METYYSITAGARRIGVSKQSLHQAICKGRCRVRIIAGRRVVTDKQLQEYTHSERFRASGAIRNPESARSRARAKKESKS